MVFPLKDITGAVVPNAYLVGIEEATNNDFQDYVYIIRNVAPFVPGVPGDYNDNGDVDAADYVVWRKNLGQPIALPNENVTPGMVTQEDYATWRANFGATAGAAAVASLPSPLRVFEAPLMGETQRDQNAAAAAAFASLAEPARNELAVELSLALPSLSDQFGRRSARQFVAAARHDQLDDAALRNLDYYFESLQRRPRSPAANADAMFNRDSNEPDDKAATAGRGNHVGRVWAPRSFSMSMVPGFEFDLFFSI